MVMSSWQRHCISSPGSSDEWKTAPSSCRSWLTWKQVCL